MGLPSGEVIARPMVARACGCLREFQHYAVDRYRAQRLAKFQKTRCEECVAKMNEQQRLASAHIPKKGEAFKQLPIGTQMTITCGPDSAWTGSLTAEGTTVQGEGEGPQGVALALARAWLTATGKAIASAPVVSASTPAPAPTKPVAVPRPAPMATKPAPKPKPG